MGLFGKKAQPPPPQPVARPPPPPSMFEIISKMRFTAKRVEKHAAKAQKQVSVEEKKSREALAKGNIDVARIHAESAIRNKNQSLQFLRLAAQIEGVSSKLKAQEVRAQVTEQLGGVTEALDTALGNMDMGEISRIMEKYGDQVEGLDVTTRFMDQELGDSAASTTPQGEVDDLLDRIAVENALDVRDQLSPTVPYQAPSTSAVADDTDARFAALSGNQAPQ